MTNEEILVRSVTTNWAITITRIENTLKAMSDAEFESEVPPGRNRVRYLVGHLAAFHDRLLELMGAGAVRHPEMAVYITNPDRSFEDHSDRADLMRTFTELSSLIASVIKSMSAADWLKPHSAITEEDYVKEPYRNRLAVLDSRTAHAALHLGQMRLALKRSV